MKENQTNPTKKTISFIFLTLSYALLDDFSPTITPAPFFIFRILFWIGVFTMAAKSILPADLQSQPWVEFKSKRKLFLLVFWFLLVLIMPHSTLIPIEIPGSVMIFIVYLPILFFHKTHGLWLLTLTCLFLLLTASFSTVHRPMAEIFAQLTYLSLATTFIIGFFSLYTKKIH